MSRKILKEKKTEMNDSEIGITKIKIKSKPSKKKIIETTQNIQLNIAENPSSNVPNKNIEITRYRPFIPAPSAPEMTEPIVVFCESNKHPIATFSPIPIFTSTNPFEEDNTKKKGRKPKGGKIVLKNKAYEESLTQVSNVILHLKCSLNDLDDYNAKINKMVTNELIYNPDIPPEIQTYNSEINSDKFSNYVENNFVDNHNSSQSINNGAIPFSNSEMTKYAYSDPITCKNPAMSLQSNLCRICNESIAEDANPDFSDEKDINMKDINHKLKNLKINLYKNTLQDKKSACFWCTYDYDNQPCYIPKYEMDEKIYGYGSFCRPECAVAYLMKENLDDSTKFERYHLLNNLYGKVYDFKKNIKPAPNPYYLLDKFFGNLSIQEYRKLLKTEHLLTVIDKPLSRTLPELFEDNDNFLLGIYGGCTKPTNNNGNVFKVKRQSEHTVAQSKSSIMKEKFGLS
jgi:hypothetical protein